MNASSKPERPTHEVWVVDRIEAGLALLVEDEGEIIVEVSAADLGKHAVEGAVLLVPLGEVGEPMWSDAVHAEDEESARLKEGEARIDRLRERDPGGDVDL